MELLTFLNLGVAPDKFIKALGSRLGSIRREGEVMVLEVQTNTWEVHFGLDTGLLELLRVTNTGPLENQG